MILNLKKLQRGGSLSSYIETLTYTPVIINKDAYGPPKAATTKSEETRASSDKSSGNLSRKDVLVALKDLDGLPNDVDMVATKLKQDFQIQNLLQGSGLLTQSQIEDQYLKDIMYINRIKQSSKLFNTTFRHAQSTGSIQEYALNPSGQVFVQDRSGQISTMYVQEYLKNKGQVKALTNGELLTLRRNSPGMAFQDSIFDTIQKGVTMAQVTDFINKFATGLAKQSLEYDGVTSVENGQIKQGIQLLKNAEALGIKLDMAVDGTYKISGASEDQKQAIQLALKTAYQAMPDSYKQLLALYGGNAENPALGAINVIAGIISSKNDSSTIKFHLTRQSDSDGEGSGGSGGTGKIHANSLMKALSGMGASRTVNLTVAEGSSTNAGYKVDAIPVATELDSTLNTLSKFITEFGDAINQGSVTMGGNRINPRDFGNILVTQSDADLVQLPIVQDNTGIIRPILDPDSLKGYRAAQQELRDLGINQADPSQAETINEVFIKHKLPPLYKQNRNMWVINTDGYRQFLVVNGQAPEDTLGEDFIKTGLQEGTGDDEDNFNRTMKSIIGKQYTNQSDPWSGMLFIPVTPNAMLEAALSRNNNSMTVSQLTALDVANQNTGFPVQQKRQKDPYTIPPHFTF